MDANIDWSVHAMQIIKMTDDAYVEYVKECERLRANDVVQVMLTPPSTPSPTMGHAPGAPRKPTSTPSPRLADPIPFVLNKGV
jgi:hypothetical protein